MKITGGCNESSKLWIPCKVTLSFVGMLCGNFPQSKEIIKAFLDGRKPNVKPAGAKPLDDLIEEAINTLPNMEEENAELMERMTIGFQMLDGKLVVRSETLRAHMKDCARQLSSLYFPKIQGERSLAVRATQGIYIDGQIKNDAGTWFNYILKDGKPIERADGYEERPIHFFTPKGERSALKKFAFVTGAVIQFTAKILDHCISTNDLKYILEYGATHGYLGERSAGNGKYSFEIEVDEKLITKKKEVVNV